MGLHNGSILNDFLCSLLEQRKDGLIVEDLLE